METGAIATVAALALTILIFAGRGIVRLFQRHNVILVILYIVFLAPIAMLHAFILGVFGSSKKELADEALKVEVERELKKQQMLDAAKAGSAR